jgi:hypothetical protein
MWRKGTAFIAAVPPRLKRPSHMRKAQKLKLDFGRSRGVTERVDDTIAECGLEFC